MIQHIALIPDGNRRWAKQQGKSPIEGHKYAVETVLSQLYDTLLELEIPYSTFWAMSSENYKKRSDFEINHLFQLFFQYFEKQLKDFQEKGIQLNVIGNLEELPSSVNKKIQMAIDATKNNKNMTFTFAMNYGGRDEIVRAVRKAVSDNVSSDAITQESLKKYFDTAEIPDPDMIIRTGGEKRTSGFLLWQSEYTEYFFLDKYFPDFTPEDLKACIEEYEHRQRRFGK